MLEQKDVMMASAAAGLTIAGFALVFMGLLLTRGGRLDRVFDAALGLLALGLFICGGLASASAFGWLYTKAGVQAIPAEFGYSAEELYRLSGAWLSVAGITAIGLVLLGTARLLHVIVVDKSGADNLQP